jgi:hypothetical protein
MAGELLVLELLLLRYEAVISSLLLRRWRCWVWLLRRFWLGEEKDATNHLERIAAAVRR